MKKNTLFIILSAVAMLLLVALLFGASNGLNGLLGSIGRDVVPDSDSPIFAIDPDDSEFDAESEPATESDSDTVIEPHVVELGIEDFFIRSLGSDFSSVECFVGTSELKPSTKYLVTISLSTALSNKDSFSYIKNSDGENINQVYLDYCVDDLCDVSYSNVYTNNSDSYCYESSFVIETNAEPFDEYHGCAISLGKSLIDDSAAEDLYNGNIGRNQHLGYTEEINTFKMFINRGFTIIFTEVIE